MERLFFLLIKRSETKEATNKLPVTVNYKASETYFSINIVFLAKVDNEDLYLEQGDYSYPFDIKLPSNLPTSFEYKEGKIRYSIYGTIDIPWA